MSQDRNRNGIARRNAVMTAGALAAACRDGRVAALEGFGEKTQEKILAGIRNREVCLPGAPEGSDSSWHLFPVHVASERRSAFLEHLKASGVGAGIHYPAAIPDQPAMRSVRYELADECALAREICASEVSLPIHPYLTDQEVTRVIDAVNAFARLRLAQAG